MVAAWEGAAELETGAAAAEIAEPGLAAGSVFAVEPARKLKMKSGATKRS